MKNNSPQLLYIAGPTASGKTALALALAQHYQTEILSCDSRQFYREMKIGTAPPSPDELTQVPHHFIHHRSLSDTYNVGAFEREALEVLEQLFKMHDIVIMVGGSGLYADAVLEGFDHFPEVPKAIRQQLEMYYQAHEIDSLQEMLRKEDPDHYARVDRQNPQRLLRALGVTIAAGKPYSSFLGKTKKTRPFGTKIMVLDLDREVLYQRIDQRVDRMIAAGLEAEANALKPFQDHPAFRTVGYQEWIPFWEGQCDRETVIEKIKRNSRRYAKRQITWFKKYGANNFYQADAPFNTFLR
jgi:tRNA dimethylallyltransferase